MVFFTRDADMIPLRDKENNMETAYLNNLINGNRYPDIQYGIKLANWNIGFGGKLFTFPNFLASLLKQF